MVPFLGRMGDVLDVWRHTVICANGQLDDVDKFFGDVVNNWGKWEGVIIRVGAWMRPIFGVKKALVIPVSRIPFLGVGGRESHLCKSPALLFFITSKRPGVANLTFEVSNWVMQGSNFWDRGKHTTLKFSGSRYFSIRSITLGWLKHLSLTSTTSSMSACPWYRGSSFSTRSIAEEPKSTAT